jgi:hypothetical protein
MRMIDDVCVEVSWTGIETATFGVEEVYGNESVTARGKGSGDVAFEMVVNENENERD